jgi:hypothetical protein
MSFFYDLNKRLADLATKQDAKQIKEEVKAAAPRSRLAESLDESAFQAAIGKKKYGDEGMKALQKAGREHAGKEKMANIRNKYDKYDEAVDQDGDVMDYLNDKLKDYDAKQTKEGNAFTGALASTPKGGKFKVGNKEFTDTSSLEEVGMTPKQKSFAKLAPPADKITFADKIAGAKKEVDEMLGDVAAEAMKAALGKGKRVVADEDGIPSSTGGTIHKTARGLRHTAGKNYGALDVSNDDSDMDDDKPKVKGRPKGSRRAIGAKGPGVKSKLLNKPSIKEGGDKCPHCGHSMNEEELDEKATSKAQQRFMGMVHAIQKGEKVKGASSELKKTAKGMKKKDAEDFAATKHKGLPEKVKAKKTEGAKPDFLDADKKEPMKKAMADKKEEKVDETTTSGSIATAPAAPKASKGMQFGKGVYESLDSKLETIIVESMNVTVNMSTDEQGQAQKSITVTATDQDADKLAELLKMAGLGDQSNQDEPCSQCGSAPCGCAEVVDENSPDWPTNTVTGGENDPNLRTYSGGLNKPKSTGQTTIPVIASQLRRTSTMEENVELERSLFKTWKNYKG